jgi:hypothetical protein
MRNIPDYGDHMTMEKFIGAVASGGFTDSDGYAKYATESVMMETETVCPSDVAKGKVDLYYSHVVWFNK